MSSLGGDRYTSRTWRRQGATSSFSAARAFGGDSGDYGDDYYGNGDDQGEVLAPGGAAAQRSALRNQAAMPYEVDSNWEMGVNPPPSKRREWLEKIRNILLRSGFLALCGVFCALVGASVLGIAMLPLVQVCALGGFLAGLIFNTIFYKQVEENWQQTKSAIQAFQNKDRNALNALNPQYIKNLPLTFLGIGFVLAGGALATVILAPSGISLTLATAGYGVGAAVFAAAVIGLFVTIAIIGTMVFCCIAMGKKNTPADESSPAVSSGQQHHQPERRNEWDEAMGRFIASQRAARQPSWPTTHQAAVAHTADDEADTADDRFTAGPQ